MIKAGQESLIYLTCVLLHEFRGGSSLAGINLFQVNNKNL